MHSSLIDEFYAGYPFEFDKFQIEACEALASSNSVLVAAPTGSGKTAVGELAVWLGLREGGKTFYTTPIKALSNQKYSDFCSVYGPASVGLLTGDNSINGDASVVVMTTEVLRNMIYEHADILRDLRYVVLDEVHYLQDPYRGGVWEEVLIHLPPGIRVVCLSATVSNAEEFGEWIRTIRGDTSVVIENRRPVRLEHHYIVENDLLPMFVEEGGENFPNPEVRRKLSRSEFRSRGRSRHTPASRRTQMRPYNRLAKRTDVVELLRPREMLPAIYFIFSRKGCEAAVRQCVRAGVSLIDTASRDQVRRLVETKLSSLDAADLDVLGFNEWTEGLMGGVAAHHAGMVPVFKETVEELFTRGIIRLVFATETLSLGINMPARTVVIERLVKFTGERHELMTAGEYTQLTGRAGRRGIDVLGHAVVLGQPDIAFDTVVGLASTETYPLVSTFQPSYNMATNLARNYRREEAEHLLNSSFAQFRIDKDVVKIEQQTERNEAYLASYREKMACDRGDFAQYWRLRDRAARLSGSNSNKGLGDLRARSKAALGGARPGQVFVVPGVGREGSSGGKFVVLRAEEGRRGEPRIVALGADRKVLRLSTRDFDHHPPRAVATIALGSKARVSDWSFRKTIAGELVALEIPPEAWEPDLDNAASGEASKLRAEIAAHPCHGCPERQKHEQWAERSFRLARDTESLQRRVRARTATLSRKFSRVLEILEDFDYVHDFSLTEKGEVLARIYSESDLLIAESLTRGWLANLDPAELSCVVSSFVFETRGPQESGGDMPTANSKRTFRRITRLCAQMVQRESDLGLALVRTPDGGFADTLFRWAKGDSLEDILTYGETAPGDFVRICKQVIDLLRQLLGVAPDPVFERTVNISITAINRGIVAYSGQL